MARGITITITRAIETRKRRKDDVCATIWTGTRWLTPSSIPDSPSLAWIYGNGPRIAKTRIEFLPPAAYRKTRSNIARQLRVMGILK